MLLILFHQVKNKETEFGWGAIVNFQKKENTRENPLNSTPTYVVDVLLHVNFVQGVDGVSSKSSICLTSINCISLIRVNNIYCFKQSPGEIKPIGIGEKGEMKVIPIALGVINKISQVRLYMSNDLRPLENRMAVLKGIEEVNKRFNNEIPLLDPIKDMRINNKGFTDLLENIKQFEQRLSKHPLNEDPDVANLYETYHEKVKVKLIINNNQSLNRGK